MAKGVRYTEEFRELPLQALVYFVKSVFRV